MPKRKKLAGVSTTALAESLGCSVGLIYKLRDQGVFKSGRTHHYWIINPTSSRPTYRWNLEKCLEVVKTKEEKQGDET